MGHYASEMDPNWNKGAKEIEKLRKAGFSSVSSVAKTYECGKCSAVVLDWRKHQAVCGEGSSE